MPPTHAVRPTPHSAHASKDTATRILDTAEGLFVEFGFDATSLRDITQQAHVHLAAVNYHIGSKDALSQAVLVRRLEPLNQQCIAELEALEASGAPFTVEAILMTFARPSLTLSKDPDRGGAMFVRLLSRAFVENHRLIRDTLPLQYSEFLVRYRNAFARVLPQLSEEERVWRLHLAFGLMFHAFAGNDMLKLFMKSDIVSARDPDTVVKHMIPFVAAGMVTPPLG